ncbi:BCSC C-terminal domain-containing protein [Shewanella avicenniae]|uniref:BCSC C-terminal domain-containing protein n=1 Tax=Shewanella avicenniae TaxID=2814294 RepID=A0ABX7QVM2_9GAMM|nr:cellulose biosynthesis protein BcsC [Shewanella avicenniae]QSX35314.1 BCSC C-terminal domain-containing protein [Shewanella avicenniae]
MNKLVLLTFTVSTLAASIQYAIAAETVTAETPEIQALFQQAEFWQGKQRQDLAKDALNRVLISSPANTEALYRLALIALQEGDATEAQRLAQQIRTISPNDNRLQELNIAQAANVDNSALKEARLLSANGQYDEAIAKYNTLFSGDEPPVSLAIEYYQTLSATKNGWATAKSGLEKLAKAQPSNSRVAIAYAQVLTYREPSRRAGIKLLANYADQDAEADKSLRNALLWLAATADDKALYDAYLARHSNDSAIADYYKQKTTLTPTQQAARYRAVGYREYAAGNYSNAATSFKAALAIDKRDADSIAGLGLISLKRNQFTEAEEQLSQAMKLAPNKQEQWRDAYQSAAFYSELANARALEKAGKLDEALAALEPLAQQNNKQAHDAKLLQGAILQQQKHLDDAEVVYRKLLQQNSKDMQARIGLVDVLRQQQRWTEASSLAGDLPESAQSQLGDLASSQAMVLRDRAAVEPDVLAEATLRQASSLAPENPWVRLDLARLLNKTNRGLAAKLLINRGIDQYGSHDDRYVAALFAKDQQRWDEAIKYLQEIPAASRNEAESSLMESLTLRARLAEIERRQTVGDREGSRQLMLDLYNHPPRTAAGVGEVASVLFENGEPGMALLLIRQHNQHEPTAAVGDYLQQILVMIKAGADEEAESLLTRLTQRRDLAPADWQDIEKIRNAITVAKADKLRLKDNFAEAYDLLAQRLRVAPNDESLLLAMARLYLSGDKGKKSLQIYRYTMEHNPNSDDAIKGAVETAIAVNELKQAEEILRGLNGDKAKEPEMLLLAAKVARADGNSRRAINLLYQSRQQLFQDEPQQPWLMASGSNPGFDNPFAPRAAQAAKQDGGDNPWRRPQWLPGSGSPETELANWDGKAVAGQPSLAQQIDAMIAEIKHDNAATLNTGMEFKTRNGESGLGEMAMVSAPSSMDFQVGNGRMKFTVTPTYLNGGTLSSGFNRFGTGVVAEGSQTLSDDLDRLPTVLDAIEAAAYNYNEAQTLYQAALSIPEISPLQLAQYQLNAERAQRTFALATQQDLLQAIGLNIDGLNPDQLAIFDDFIDGYVADTQNALSSTSLQAFLASREQLESLVGSMRSALNSVTYLAQNPPAQSDAGIELNFAYSNDFLAADIGVTPLGFEKTNLVGGFSWTPQLNNTTRLELGIERRAVKDSVLSYAGTVDPMSGETWGGVTKTGLKAGIGFDDGELGMYGNLGGYLYKGSHVDSNTAFDIALGGYLRPINDKERELQTGVHVSFQVFDKNLGHYSFGHGGYFSPQDFVSIAFPIKYSEKHEKYNFAINFAPGFQSFTEERSDYFPNEPVLQGLANLMAQLNLIEESVYSANSKTGFGMSLNAQGEYEFSPSFTLGGKVGFDNFGNYQETSASLYLKYLLGVKSE